MWSSAGGPRADELAVVVCLYTFINYNRPVSICQIQTAAETVPNSYTISYIRHYTSLQPLQRMVTTRHLVHLLYIYLRFQTIVNKKNDIENGLFPFSFS